MVTILKTSLNILEKVGNIFVHTPTKRNTIQNITVHLFLVKLISSTDREQWNLTEYKFQ